MKRIFISIAIVLALGTITANAEEKEVILHQTSVYGNTKPHSIKRSPIYIPRVYIDDHTLYFEENCIDREVLILQDDEVVYSAVVDEDRTVELPDALSGVYEIQIYQGSRTFVGEFEL